jgi:hypothetical protein
METLTFYIHSDISNFTGIEGTITLPNGTQMTAAANLEATPGGTINFIYTPPKGLEVHNNPYFMFFVTDSIAPPVDPYRVTVTVNKPTLINPPLSGSFSQSLYQDNSASLVFDPYVSDPDGNPFTVWVTSVPTNGHLVITSNSITVPSNSLVQIPASTYIPNTRWWGNDSFTYQTYDSYNLPSVLPGIVSITVIHMDALLPSQWT